MVCPFTLTIICLTAKQRIASKQMTFFRSSHIYFEGYIVSKYDAIIPSKQKVIQITRYNYSILKNTVIPYWSLVVVLWAHINHRKPIYAKMCTEKWSSTFQKNYQLWYQSKLRCHCMPREGLKQELLSKWMQKQISKW